MLNAEQQKQFSHLRAIEHIVLPVLRGDQDNTHQLFKIRFLRIFKVAIPIPFLNRLIGRYLFRNLRKMAERGSSLYQIELRQRKFFKRLVSQKRKLKKGRTRAKTNYKKVRPYLVDEEFTTILDLGSGNGLLAEEIAYDQVNKSKSILTADVLDYRFSSRLPFIKLNQNSEIPLEDNSVDVTLLYVVVHHSDDPDFLLEEVSRITRKRIVLMEGYADSDIEFKVNGTMDWWLNRVGQGYDINVPIHYKTKKEWYEILRLYGFKVILYKDMGIDDEMAPERHVLIVAEKDKDIRSLK